MVTTGGESKCKRCGRWFVPKEDGQEYGPKCSKYFKVEVKGELELLPEKEPLSEPKIAPPGGLPLVLTTMVTQHGMFVGWKVYINGRKYPRKPTKMYAGVLEDMAIRTALMDAGFNPDIVKDIIEAQIPGILKTG